MIRSLASNGGTIMMNDFGGWEDQFVTCEVAEMMSALRSVGTVGRSSILFYMREGQLREVPLFSLRPPRPAALHSINSRSGRTTWSSNGSAGRGMSFYSESTTWSS